MGWPAEIVLDVLPAPLVSAQEMMFNPKSVNRTQKAVYQKYKLQGDL